MRRLLGVALASAGCVMLFVAGCDRGGPCSPSGPSGKIMTASGTLAPGEQRLIVVDTPAGTSELRVTGTFTNLEMWTIDPNCTQPIDQCFKLGPTDGEGSMLIFGSPRGHNYNDFAATTRFLVKNTRQDMSVEYSLKFTPWRPTCT